MDDAHRFRLLFGPYSAPAVRPGDALRCERRGEDVVVDRMSDAPIPWPMALYRGKPGLIVCGDLVRAVRAESTVAIAHWWGITYPTACNLRRSVGVRGVTRGSRESIARSVSANLKGRKAPPGVAERMRGISKRPRTEEHIRKVADAFRARMEAARRGEEGGRKGSWSDADLALLGTMPDTELAERLGRTEVAVRYQRQARHIGKYRPK